MNVGRRDIKNRSAVGCGLESSLQKDESRRPWRKKLHSKLLKANRQQVRDQVTGYFTAVLRTRTRAERAEKRVWRLLMNLLS